MQLTLKIVMHFKLLILLWECLHVAFGKLYFMNGIENGRLQ